MFARPRSNYLLTCFVVLLAHDVIRESRRRSGVVHVALLRRTSYAALLTRHDPHCQISFLRRCNTFHGCIYWRCSFSACSCSLCGVSLCRLLHNRLPNFCSGRLIIAEGAGGSILSIVEKQATHTSTFSAISPNILIRVLIARHAGDHGRDTHAKMTANHIYRQLIRSPNHQKNLPTLDHYRCCGCNAAGVFN